MPIELDKSKLVVVAGAGGFIGGHLVAQLLADGYSTVRAIDNKPIGQWYQRPAGVEYVQADLRSLDACRAAVNGASYIFDLAADMGLIGQTTHPEVEEQLLAVLQKCQLRNVPCVGVATNLEEAAKRVKQGFRIIIAPMERGMATVVRSAASTTELTH